MKRIDVDVGKIAELALDKLKSMPVEAAEISANQSRGFSVTARMQAVETVEHHLEKSFSVTVFQQQRTGSASSSDFSRDSIYHLSVFYLLSNFLVVSLWLT